MPDDEAPMTSTETLAMIFCPKVSGMLSTAVSALEAAARKRLCKLKTQRL